MQRQTNNRISVWDGLFYNDIPSAQYETFHVAATVTKLEQLWRTTNN